MIRKIFALYIFLFVSSASAYEIVGYDGTLLSPNTQAQIGAIDTLNLVSGVIVFNQTANAYQMWDGAAWVAFGGGGATPPYVEVYRANNPTPATNPALIHFQSNVLNLATNYCGSIVATAASGTYFQATTGCQLSATANVTANLEGFFGFVLNPTASELLGKFEDIPITKKLCIAKWQGVEGYTAECSFSTLVYAGDRVYIQAFPGATYSTVNQSTIQFVTSSTSAVGGGGGGSGDVTGPISSTVDNFASFATTSGKVIKDSGISSLLLVTQNATSTEANRISLSDGANRIKKDSPYKIPSLVCPVGEGLISDGTDYVCGKVSVTQYQYVAHTLLGYSTDNLTSPYFGTVTTNTIDSTNCGTITNDSTSGFSLNFAKKAKVDVKLVSPQMKVSYYIGFTKNPTATELDTPISVVDRSKIKCKSYVLGIKGNVQSCSFSATFDVGDTFNLQTSGESIINSAGFEIDVTCTL